jgi:hypothetical protein
MANYPVLEPRVIDPNSQLTDGVPRARAGGSLLPLTALGLCCVPPDSPLWDWPLHDFWPQDPQGLLDAVDV